MSDTYAKPLPLPDECKGNPDSYLVADSKRRFVGPGEEHFNNCMVVA